jgi:hypothetical protein
MNFDVVALACLASASASVIICARVVGGVGTRSLRYQSGCVFEFSGAP